MSSRNAYLSPEQREAAPAVYRALQLAERLYSAGERSAEKLRHAMMEILEAEALLQPAYASIAGLEDLTELDTVDCPALVSLAVRIGTTRLIDNTILPPGQEIQ